MRSVRPICEVIFYFLLLAYGAGVRAYMERSIREGIRAKRPRESTSGWAEANTFATLALSHATNAAMVATTLDPEADEETEVALKYLQQRFAIWCSLFPITELIGLLKCSLDAIPASHKKNRNLLSSWDEEQLKFC